MKDYEKILSKLKIGLDGLVEAFVEQTNECGQLMRSDQLSDESKKELRTALKSIRHNMVTLTQAIDGALFEHDPNWHDVGGESGHG